MADAAGSACDKGGGNTQPPATDDDRVIQRRISHEGNEADHDETGAVRTTHGRAFRIYFDAKIATGDAGARGAESETRWSSRYQLYTHPSPRLRIHDCTYNARCKSSSSSAVQHYLSSWSRSSHLQKCQPQGKKQNSGSNQCSCKSLFPSGYCDHCYTQCCAVITAT